LRRSAAVSLEGRRGRPSKNRSHPSQHGRPPIDTTSLFSAVEPVLASTSAGSLRPTTTPFRAPEFDGEAASDAVDDQDDAETHPGDRERMRTPFAASADPA